MAACRLLRVSGCLVFKVSAGDSSPILTLVAGDPQVSYSQSLIHVALDAKKPVVAADDAALNPAESLLLAGVRSAMAAAVRVRGRAVAVIYVTSERLGLLFRDDDVKLAEFIVALAGAALENAESFSQLQLLNDSLETQATERRRALDELSAARNAAETANQAKSEFLANISHEIRTPLGSILGYVELMEAAEDADSRQYLPVIRRNGDQLLELVNDLLDLSKIEAGRLIVEQVPIRLADELAGTVALIKPRATQKSLDLTLTIADGLPSDLVTDPLRLRQILLNILGNAIKFTAAGKIEVVAGRASRHGNPDRLAISVTDSGIGMTEAEAGRLFQPFTQADASTSRRFGGTGLGLALARKLAVALGGELGIERTAPGKGSTFTLWLDVAPKREGAWADRGAVMPVPVPVPNPAIAAQALAGLKILVVEDMPDNQRFLLAVLTRFGAVVEVASDGRTGLRKARQGGFDLILLDNQLPEMDGLEVLKILRSEDVRTPIVILTANALKEERERFLGAGADDYATKPIGIERLVAVIRQRVKPILTFAPDADDGTASLP